MHLHATGMLKIAVIVSLNVAIMAVVTTLRETPETYVEWKIDTFFDLPAEKSYSLSSPQFSFAYDKWFLKLYPYGFNTEGFISVFLFLKETGFESEHRVEYTLGSKTVNGSTFISFKSERGRIFNKTSSSWGWSTFMNRSTIPSVKDTAFPNDTFTVFCRVRVVDSIEIIPEITSSNGLETLSENLKNLYASKRFTDVTLIVKDKEFPAHRNLLSSRFAAFGSMLETIPDKIEISDCDPESFEEFLFFIYTGKLVKVSSKKAMGLYLTANKYNLPELKEECARSIAEHDLNIDSFYDILAFAKLYSESVLLTAVTDFFIANAKFILPTEKWETFLAKNPSEGNKLFLRYTKK